MTVSIAHGPVTEFRHTNASFISGTIPTPTAGNILVAIFSSYLATIGNSSVSDNQGNAWETIAELQTPDANYLLSVHWAFNVATGSPFVVTFDTNQTGYGISGFVIEIAGTDPVSPREPSEIMTLSGTSTAPTTALLTNSSQDALILAATAVYDNNDPITLTDPGAPWSLVGEELLGATYDPLSIVARIVAASVASQATWITPSEAWATVILAFQGAPTTFGPPPGRGPA